MKIIYHHSKDPKKDKNDNWWTCPPELICTDKERDKLYKAFHFVYSEEPLFVDPLSPTQVNYAIYNHLPKLFRKLFLGKVEKEHKYDNICTTK